MSGRGGGKSPSSRLRADPSWYESEFRAGDLMGGDGHGEDCTGSATSSTREDDPLDGALIVSSSSSPYPTDAEEADEIIQGDGAGGVGKHQVRRYLCGAALLVVFVLAVVVPIAVVVPRNKQAAQQQQQQPADPTDTSSSVPLYLNPPSEDLAAMCQLNDPRCQEECARSECCSVPAGVPGACLQAEDYATGLVCNLYMQACQQIPDGQQGQDDQLYDDADTGLFENFTDDSAGVPVAASNLADLCSLASFSGNTGVRNCAQQCAPGRCCWGGGAEETDCFDEPNCPGYAPCAYLLAHNNVGNEVEQYVQQACDPQAVAASEQAREECQSACSVATCCFVVEGANDVFTDETPCFGKPDGFCEQYLSCIAVLVDTGVPSDSDPFEDSESYDISAPPVGIAATCDPNIVYGNDAAMQQCSSLCSTALCCYLPALGPDSCLDTHLQICSQWRVYCDAVFSSQDGGLLDEADDVSATYDLDEGNTDYLLDVCSPESLSTPTGMQECSAQCSPAACCWTAVPAEDQDENCQFHNTCTDYQLCRLHENCDSYAPCLNLQNMNSAGSQQVSDNIATSVADLCSDVTTQQGVANCQSVCLQHSCCFQDSWNCTQAVTQGGYVVDLQSLVEACEDYQGCSVLFNPNAGANLWSGGQSLPPVSSEDQLAAELAAACEEAQIAANITDACVEACSPGSCCALPENVEGSCLMHNHDMCMIYHKECSVLDENVGIDHNDEADVPEVTNSAEIVAFCSVASLSTDFGRGRCQELCSNATCCWSTDLDASVGEISCRDNLNCPGYAPCLALAASETVDESVSNQVATTCTLFEAQDERSQANIAKCRAVCIQHKCCWYEGSTEETCFGSDACGQYDGCKWLIQNP